MRSSRSLLPSCLSFLLLSVPVAAFCSGFIENRGQWHENVLYYLDGPRTGIYLTRDALVFDLKERVHSIDRRTSSDFMDRADGEETERTAALSRKGVAVYVRFRHDGAVPRVEATGETGTKYNYFLGDDPEKWRTNVPSYQEVVYHNLWDSGDLILRTDGASVIYELMTTGEGELPTVSFVYSGAERIAEETGGEISVETAYGAIVHHCRRDGDLTGSFRIAPSTLQKTARDHEMRDGPQALAWSTVVGGSSWEWGNDVAVDSAGNIVVVGWTGSGNFPTTPGAYDESLDTYNGNAIVFKLNGAGSELIWSTFIAGEDYDRGEALSLDRFGNPVVTGRTYSGDFPTTPGAYDETHNGGGDAFIAKLSADGSTLLWSTFLGGSVRDRAYAIALDQAGNPVLCGDTESGDFPTTPGAYDESYNGSSVEAFVAKLDSQGQNLIWSTFLGGGARDYGWALSLDRTSHPVVSGLTDGAGFPTTSGAFDEIFNGNFDAFVTKFSPSGSTLVWSTFLGGGGMDAAKAIVLDPEDNPLVTGYTDSDEWPITPGAYDETGGSVEDVFLTKLNASGSGLEWSTYLGGNGRDLGFGTAIDSWGNVWVTGFTKSTDFPTEGDGSDTSHNGYRDAFLTKLNETGSAVLWSSYLGGGIEEEGYGLALDSAGNPLFTGAAYSSDFPTTPGAYDETPNGEYDVFVCKLNLDELTGLAQGRNAPSQSVIETIAPNPFNPTTTIRFTIHKPQWVRITVHDLAGRRIAVLLDGYHEAGSFECIWGNEGSNQREASSGVYFASLRTESGVSTRKIMLIR